MKDDAEEVVVDEDGNVVESAIERVKPDLDEVLEDDGTAEDDDDDSDDVVEDEDDSEEEESEE